MKSPANEMASGFHMESNELRSLITEEWMDTRRAAEYLCLAEGSLRNLVSMGKIPYYKLGRGNRFRVADLRNLLLSNRRGGFYGN